MHIYIIVYMSRVQIHLIPFFISCIYVFNAFTTVLSFKPNYIINYAYYILVMLNCVNFCLAAIIKLNDVIYYACVIIFYVLICLYCY